MADTPEAAPVTPTGTEETPNTTPQTTETTTPAAAPQGEAQQQDNNYGFTGDQLKELSSFIKGQGGYDKAFNAWKDSISKPAEQQPTAQPEQPAQQPQQQITQEEQMQALQTPAGFVSPKEFMAQQYYNNLANQEEFKPIADKIRSGEVFNEMRKFGIQPMDQNGNINDVQAREFLGLLAKTVPAQPAQTPESAAAPTVDYVPVNGGKIESYEQAARILAQSEQLRSQNLAEHPDVAAAKEYVKNILTGNKKKQYNCTILYVIKLEDTANHTLAVFFITCQRSVYNEGMESMTLGDISGVLVFIAGLLTSGGIIARYCVKSVGKVVKEETKPINDSIKEIQAHLEEVDMANCKNYLVGFLAKFQCKGDYCQKIIPEELERFWENYDHYVAMGGNSYVKSAVEKLKKEGKL